MKTLILISFLSLLLLACGKEKSSSNKSSNSVQSVKDIYASSTINIHVFYEEGAEPFTGEKTALAVRPWNLFQNNLEALFQGRKLEPEINVPKTLSEMKKIKVLNKTSWTAEDALSVAKTENVSEPDGTSAFKIFFVNGYAADGTGVIAFHVSGSRVMIVFKDVIESMSAGEVITQTYIEQATIIHEMGHALGLVNNGLPMVSSHQDKDHGAHCNNPDCVMYWANEGKNDMISFARKVVTSGSTVMFDNKCLQDSRDY